MSFKLSGKIKVIGDTVQVSDKFSKRDLVITDESGMYPQFLKMQLAQDKCSLLDSFQVDEPVEVSFNLNGRIWNNPTTKEEVFFTTLDVWRIDKLSAPKTQQPPANVPVTDVAQGKAKEDEDGLPF